jgi:hypothetical protein
MLTSRLGCDFFHYRRPVCMFFSSAAEGTPVPDKPSRYFLSLQYDFSIKIEIKQFLDKEKEYSIQKIEITPKRLEIGIHNVNKSGLRTKLYIYILCQKCQLLFKKMKFSTFFIINFEKLQ